MKGDVTVVLGTSISPKSMAGAYTKGDLTFICARRFSRNICGSLYILQLDILLGLSLIESGLDCGMSNQNGNP